MNITITGSLGNIGRRLTAQLTEKGHKVTVISRSSERAKEIEQLKATPAIGSIDDAAFLQQAFSNADAVFAMIPPAFHATDIRAHIRAAGDRYVEAIAQTGVPYVVNLSSIGAHMPDGPGPAGANYYVEQKLNGLEKAHVLHLRPGMFYTNFYGMIPMIQHQGFIGNNFSAAAKMVLTHPHDIADAAADAIHNRSFTGKNIRYIAGDEKNGAEVAAILGAAIGKPELPWIEFTDEQLLQGMMQQGFTEEMATVYIIEIGAALRNGNFLAGYYQNKKQALGKTCFEDFAKEFATVYLQMS